MVQYYGMVRKVRQVDVNDLRLRWQARGNIAYHDVHEQDSKQPTTLPYAE
jgi:hypothetical protein